MTQRVATARTSERRNGPSREYAPFCPTEQKKSRRGEVRVEVHGHVLDDPSPSPRRLARRSFLWTTRMRHPPSGLHWWRKSCRKSGTGGTAGSASSWSSIPQCRGWSERWSKCTMGVSRKRLLRKFLRQQQVTVQEIPAVRLQNPGGERVRQRTVEQIPDTIPDSNRRSTFWERSTSARVQQRTDEHEGTAVRVHVCG